MRTFGAPRAWPPEPGAELSTLLSTARWAGTRRNEEPRPTILAALADLRGWLEDHRPYHHRHEPSWKSVCRDTGCLIADRGARLTAQTPALTALTTELASPGLGADPPRRRRAGELLEAGLAELAETASVAAAFLDLADAVTDLDCVPETLAALLDFLAATLEAGSRSLAAECSTLAGIADDSLLEVGYARHELDGAPVPDFRSSLNADAGLVWTERLELGRRWLARPLKERHHVVWLGYSQARCFWQLPISNVTLFDGPELLSALNQLDKEPDPALADRLPAELRPGSRLAEGRESHWPTDLDRWVAVRVDLGNGLFADPVATARAQAEALVKFASFHARGSSWELFHGYKVIIDGELAGESHPFGPPVDMRDLTDRTDQALEALTDQLAKHVLPAGPRLADLVDAAAVVQAERSPDDVTGLLNDVRVIEMIAAMCGTDPWQAHLKDCFARRWARREVLNGIFNAVEQAVSEDQFRGHIAERDHRQLRTYGHGSTGRHFEYHVETAFTWLPGLAVELDVFHPKARQVRTVAARTTSVSALEQWFGELIEEYNSRVARLARCRNSMAHGGPLQLAAARTIAPFANQEASATTSLALWGAMDGQGVAQEHTRLRVDEASRASAMAGSSSVTDGVQALLGQEGRK